MSTTTPQTRTTRRRTALAVLLLAASAAAGCRDEAPDDGAGDAAAATGESGDPVPYLVGPTAGRWHEIRSRQFDPDLSDEEREKIAELESIGYSDGLHDAPDLIGVTRHDPERASPGLNLYTSAHEAMSALVDMEGNVLHRWMFPIEQAFPRYPYPKDNKLATFWRRTFLQPNGDLLAIYEGLGLVKVDRDSRLLWKTGNRAHHDLEVMPDGSIWVLTRQAGKVPSVSATEPVLEDFLTLLGPDGRLVREISVYAALEGTEFEPDWEAQLAEFKSGDLCHTNTIAVLDGSLEHVDPAFRAGNLLVSMLLLDLVAVVDADSGKVVWGRVGPYARQHDSQVLDAGTILVFDNQGAGLDAEVSRVLELDPATWDVVWSFEGTPAEPFYSQTCGLAQRLPNGNTLITETDFGRAFEVTADGAVVWEFHNPHRAGEDGRYIATLMEVMRLPPDFPTDWVHKK